GPLQRQPRDSRFAQGARQSRRDGWPARDVQQGRRAPNQGAVIRSRGRAPARLRLREARSAHDGALARSALMSGSSFLGLDVGTSGVKAILVATSGEIEASATTPLELSTPKPGWAEQDPNVWWAASVSSIKSVLAARPGARVASVGISGQMHSSV